MKASDVDVPVSLPEEEAGFAIGTEGVTQGVFIRVIPLSVEKRRCGGGLDTGSESV
ncbi:MAG: hypothetical protein OXF02_05375 [Simkaniaceae bacterium]|nr:hypothetical protein [Simkaniaceae bacterium]